MKHWIIAACYFTVSIICNLHAETKSSVPHQVLAFYYPWYGIVQGPAGHGQVLHWSKIDTEKKDIAASRNYPALGAYDSHDPKVIDQHCTWASQSGIDTFIVSWWGHGSVEDLAMPQILETCSGHNMTACVYYEAVPDPKSPQSAADDIIKILEHYASHPAYLKVGGKPVVFVYVRAIDDIGLYGWYQAKQLIRKQFKSDVILVGDRTSYAGASIFDATHTYNTCGQLAGKNVEQIQVWTKQQYSNWIFMAQDLGMISTVTIIPGYDDTKIRKPGLDTKRLDGQLYKTQWDSVLSLLPDWVIITSFNEWHEGSEIEPSIQYGDHYLKLTEQYAKKFKVKQAGSTFIQPKRYYYDVPPGIKTKLQGKTIAVLPDPESAAFGYVLKTGANVKILSWKEVAAGLDPKMYAMVLYACGENYCPTAQKQNDVDEAIVNYLKAGGTLVVLASGPLPFYYDQDGKAVNRASKFGLTLDMGWERPPVVTTVDKDGLQETKPRVLTFVEPELEKDTSEAKPGKFEIDFSVLSEKRWRPFKAAEGVKSTSLLILKDQVNERSYGEGLVIVYPATGGKVAYGWSGLLQCPYEELICTKLFEKLLK